MCLLNLLISISSRGGSRTPLRINIDFFVTTANDLQRLTDVVKNFILDATDVLDLPHQDYIQDYSLSRR